jgi:hypothetical protein
MPNNVATKEELDEFTAELEDQIGADNAETTLSTRDLVLFGSSN